MTTIPLPTKKITIVDTMPKPSELPDGTTYGNYSCTLPDKKTLVPYHYWRTFGGAQGTETMFSRSWMQTLPPRKYRQAQHMYMKISRPPLYVRPSFMQNSCYIDIKHAYPSIYNLCGWEVEYLRGQYIGLSEPLVYPYPSAWKVGRSYIVTGSRPFMYSRHIFKGEIQTKKYYNKKLANPSLVAFVNDTLAMIARFATYALGARYYNTDGGIFAMRAAPIFIDFCKSIGLDARIKHEGTAEILSSGYWRVGSHETKNYAKHVESNITAGDYITLSKREAEWMYSKLTKGIKW